MATHRFATLVNGAHFNYVHALIPAILRFYDRDNDQEDRGVAEFWSCPTECGHIATPRRCQQWIGQDGFRVATVPEFLAYFGRKFRFEESGPRIRVVCLDPIVARVEYITLGQTGISIAGGTFFLTVEIDCRSQARRLEYIDGDESQRFVGTDRVLVMRTRQ